MGVVSLGQQGCRPSIIQSESVLHPWHVLARTRLRIARAISHTFLQLDEEEREQEEENTDAVLPSEVRFVPADKTSCMLSFASAKRHSSCSPFRP